MFKQTRHSQRLLYKHSVIKLLSQSSFCIFVFLFLNVYATKRYELANNWNNNKSCQFFMKIILGL